MAWPWRGARVQGGSVKVCRVVAVAVILLNLALLAVYPPLRATALRYRTAARQKERRSLELENRALVHQAAMARRPDRVAARAAAFGIDVRTMDRGQVDRKSVAKAPPR